VKDKKTQYERKQEMKKLLERNPQIRKHPKFRAKGEKRKGKRVSKGGGKEKGPEFRKKKKKKEKKRKKKKGEKKNKILPKPENPQKEDPLSPTSGNRKEVSSMIKRKTIETCSSGRSYSKAPRLLCKTLGAKGKTGKGKNKKREGKSHPFARSRRERNVTTYPVEKKKANGRPTFL